jgi:hypothetical protein
MKWSGVQSHGRCALLEKQGWLLGEEERRGLATKKGEYMSKGWQVLDLAWWMWCNTDGVGVHAVACAGFGKNISV